MPKNPGSPDARTAAAPSCSRSAAIAGTSGPRVMVRTSRGNAAASRWRAPPITRVAASSAARAAGGNAVPSQPITVTAASS
ncbi:MAG TPA: hypothetical protein VGM10_35540 [Actinocrinis sp.]